MENKKIIVYTSPTCPYCDMARDYFKTKSILYEEKSTADPENRKKLVSMGIRGVPAIFIGENYFVGFDPVEIERLMSEVKSAETDFQTETNEDVETDDHLKAESADQDNLQQTNKETTIEAEAVKNRPDSVHVTIKEKDGAEKAPEHKNVKVEETNNRREPGNMKKYICQVCGYVYDPADGDEDNGIAPGTSFEALPEEWVCPLCGVGKDQFEEE